MHNDRGASTIAFLALVFTMLGPSRVDACFLPESALPLLNWHVCVKHAVDVLYDQLEPANTVATAAFATCVEYELAFAKAAGGGSCGVEWANGVKDRVLIPSAIAQIMALRAAQTHKPTHHKAARPAIDYNRM